MCKKPTDQQTQIATTDEEASINSETKSEYQQKINGFCRSVTRLHPRIPFN